MLAQSTDEALKKISRQRFDTIIFDMGRPPDSRAGYTLLDKLRSSRDQTPFIIYAGSRDPEHVAESRRHGAIGCINNANELFEMVLSALGHDALKRQCTPTGERLSARHSRRSAAGDWER